MDKSWYRSKTVWGAILIFIAGVAGGLVGEPTWITGIAGVVGIPLSIIGIRDAL